MYFFALSTVALVLSSPAVIVASNGGQPFVAKDYYLNNIAATELQRLSNYANKHDGTLTAAQADFLSKAKTAVSTFDTSSFDSLRSEAEALFAPEDAKFILTGKTAMSKARRGEGSALGKRNTCQCSTADSWCDNNTACSAGAGGCGRTSSGCGLFNGYACDGLCVNPPK